MEKLIHESKKLRSFIAVLSTSFIISGIAIPTIGILFLFFVNNSAISIILISILIIAFNLFLLSRSIKNFTENVKLMTNFYESLSKGNIPDHFKPSIIELEKVSDYSNSTASELKNIKDFFIKVGEGDLNNDIHVFNDEGELGKTLSNVREELKKVSEADRQRNWINEGLSKLGEILRKETDLDKLCNDILFNLIKYIGANQGNVFIINDNITESLHLELKATYAYGRKKYLKKRINPGEGITGQAWLEMDTIYLKEIPQNYTTIRSGLGEATPNNLIVIPLKNDLNIQGVLEIASFKYFQPFEVKFIERVAESIAMSISNTKVTERTRKLLEETQLMTEQMRAQEEEMRQNMEELEATQEEMQRNTNEILKKEVNLNSLINNIDAAVVSIDINFRILSVNNEMRKIYEQRGTNFKLGDNVLEKLPTDQKEYRQKLYLRVFGGEKFSIVEEVPDMSTNQKMFMEITHIPIVDDFKKVTGATIFVKNITKDVLLRKDIENKQALLEGLINNTDDNIMALDRDYTVTIINDRYKERYASMGYEYGVGVNAFKVMDATIHDEWKGYYDRALGGEKFSFQKTFDDPVKTITRGYSFNPIKDANQNVVGLSIFNRLMSEIVK